MQAKHPRAVLTLNLFDHDAVDLVRHVVEAIRDLFEMLVDFSTHDEVHRVAVAVLEKEFFHADVVEVVDAAFEAGDFLG